MTESAELARADVTGPFTVSWLRAYSCVFGPQDLPALADGSAFQVTRIAPDEDFYDIQTLDLHQVARVKLGGLRLSSPCASPVQTHVLVHAAGFCLIRLTVHSADIAENRPEAIADFHQFHQAMWDGAHPATWGFPDDEASQLFGARQAMDWVFFDLHERFFFRPTSNARLAELASLAWRHHDRLTRKGELDHAYPVSFGTHYEITPARHLSETESRQWGERFICGDHSADIGCAEVERPGGGCAWYLSENKSLVLLHDGGDARSELDGMNDMKLQLMEYMTLRRAALRTVQRDTQALVACGGRPSTRQLRRWTRVVTALADEYTLHDAVGRYLGPAKARLTDDEHLRDLGELEDQVRANMAGFTAEHQLATARAQTFLGAAFGVVAGLGVADLVASVPGLNPSALGETWLSVGFLGLGITVALVVLGGLWERVLGIPFRRRLRRVRYRMFRQ